MQYGFYFDATRCIGCRTCAIACKDWNDTQPGAGVIWRRVLTSESGEVPKVVLANLSSACNHCAKPACVAVCPTGAVTKRAEDGIVVVDQDKCIACHACEKACPFGVPQFGENTKMQKCNYCVERVAEGLLPACAAACPVQALVAGPMEELSLAAAKKGAVQMAGPTEPSVLLVPVK